jgi:hypothetical protein
MGKKVNDVAKINWHGYAGKEAVFPVCMRSPAVNGRRLTAQLTAAAQKMDNLVFVVCDSLDRHNFQNSVDAKKHSLFLGEQWINANFNTIKDFFPRAEILSWENNILNHPLYNLYKKTVDDLYINAPRVKQLVDSVSVYYLIAKKKQHLAQKEKGFGLRFDADAALKGCREYIKEELAGDMVYYQLTGGLPHIYWGIYVDEHNIFSRESGLDLGFPQTLEVTSKRLGPSISISELKKLDLWKQFEEIQRQDSFSVAA